MAYRNPLIYERIETLVKQHGMVMFDLTKKLGISSGNMSDWKAGKATPSTEKLIKIADLFNVSIDYLIGRDTYDSKMEEPDAVELFYIYRNLDREGKTNVLSAAYLERRRIKNDAGEGKEAAEA